MKPTKNLQESHHHLWTTCMELKNNTPKSTQPRHLSHPSKNQCLCKTNENLSTVYKDLVKPTNNLLNTYDTNAWKSFRCRHRFRNCFWNSFGTMFSNVFGIDCISGGYRDLLPQVFISSLPISTSVFTRLREELLPETYPKQKQKHKSMNWNECRRR